MPQFANATPLVDTHPLAHNAKIDVKAMGYLKGDGTTEVAGNITALQAISAGKEVYWPPGTYNFPDGVGFVLAAGSHHHGVHRQTIISVKNAYGFTGTTLVDIKIAGFSVSVRSGSTTGGAVKSIGGGNNSWRISDVYGDGQATLTTPMFHFQGWIGNVVEGCHASVGDIGFLFDSTGFCNSNTMWRCGANSQATAGVKTLGARSLMIRDGDWETSSYGIWLTQDTAFCRIEGNWFESNTNHSLFIDGTGANPNTIWVMGNAFHGGAGGAGQRHIYAITSTSNIRSMHSIEHNTFPDLAGSGKNIELGTGVTHCSVQFNRAAGLGTGTIVVADPTNVIAWNDNTANLMDNVSSFPSDPVVRYGAVSTNRLELSGTGTTNSQPFAWYRSASSTSFPRFAFRTDQLIDGTGGHTALVIGATLDTTDPVLHGGALWSNTDSLLFSVGNGAGLISQAFVNIDTFATTTTATKLGFRGSTPITKQTVTGSRGGNAALADLLTKLAALGLITDGSS